MRNRLWRMNNALMLALLFFMSGCGDMPPPHNTRKVAVTGKSTVFDFTRISTEWNFAEGNWACAEYGVNWVLKQSATDKAFPLALLQSASYTDMDVSVRFCPASGAIDASGGIVFRAQDSKNYYVVRANALEENFRLYTVINGDRKQICGTTVDPPRLGEWHSLRVVATNDHIQAYLNNKLLIDFKDTTYSSGFVGLWTKADSVTLFDDLKIIGE